MLGKYIVATLTFTAHFETGQEMEQLLQAGPTMETTSRAVLHRAAKLKSSSGLVGPNGRISP